MPYTDIYLVPVKRAQESVYLDQARLAQVVWQDHGALSYVEYRAEDVPGGRVTSLPMAVKLAEDEVLFMGLVTFRDRAHRDEVNVSVFDDPRIQAMMSASAANMQHMIFGGFVSVI